MSDQCIVVRNILSMFMMCSAALELIKLQVEIFEEEDEEIIDVNLVELSAIVANTLTTMSTHFFFINNQGKRLKSPMKNAISIEIGLRLIWFNFCSVPTTGTEDMALKAESI
jgi:hypothetical protein